MYSNLKELSDKVGFELELNTQVQFENQEDLLVAIKQRVSELLLSNPGLLFSYLYRLDVSEERVREVLNSTGEIATDEELAQLILERQLSRIETKKNLRQRPIEGWEW